MLDSKRKRALRIAGAIQQATLELGTPCDWDSNPVPMPGVSEVSEWVKACFSLPPRTPAHTAALVLIASLADHIDGCGAQAACVSLLMEEQYFSRDEARRIAQTGDISKLGYSPAQMEITEALADYAAPVSAHVPTMQFIMTIGSLRFMRDAGVVACEMVSESKKESVALAPETAPKSVEKPVITVEESKPEVTEKSAETTTDDSVSETAIDENVKSETKDTVTEAVTGENITERNADDASNNNGAEEFGSLDTERDYFSQETLDILDDIMPYLLGIEYVPPEEGGIDVYVDAWISFIENHPRTPQGKLDKNARARVKRAYMQSCAKNLSYNEFMSEAGFSGMAAPDAYASEELIKKADEAEKRHTEHESKAESNPE